MRSLWNNSIQLETLRPTMGRLRVGFSFDRAHLADCDIEFEFHQLRGQLQPEFDLRQWLH